MMSYNTNIYEFPDVKGVVISGDVHGDFATLVHKVCVQYGITDTLIVVAGDCGFGFNRPGYYENLYNKLSSRLAKANNWIVFVRGNHDNPAYFDGQQVDYERWKAVPDYSILKACDHTILCVGGAISLDRKLRINREYQDDYLQNKWHKYHPYPAIYSLSPRMYWRDEAPVYDQGKLEVISKDHSIDVVITHVAPSFCLQKKQYIIDDWWLRDMNIYSEIMGERKVMDNICAFLKGHNHPLQHWFYGHIHESWHDEIDGVNYRLLDIMQLHKLGPDDDEVNSRAKKEHDDELEKLATLAAKLPIF